MGIGDKRNLPQCVDGKPTYYIKLKNTKIKIFNSIYFVISIYKYLFKILKVLIIIRILSVERC